MKELKEQTSEDFTYTKKERAFCYAYAELGSPSAAYKVAYNASRMTPGSISTKGSVTLAKVKIRLLCEEIRRDLEKRNQITLDEIVQDLAKMVRFDIADLYTPEGDLKNIHDMPKEGRMMIGSMDIDALFEGYGPERHQIGHTKKVKLLNRLDILEKLMKYFDGYNKHNQSKKPTSQVMIIQLPENHRDPQKIIDLD